MTNTHGQLRVWHIPQVPMKAFHADVSSIAEGLKLLRVLADYDDFQFKNKVKGDYCNVQGIQVWDKDCPDEDGDCWVDLEESEYQEWEVK